MKQCNACFGACCQNVKIPLSEAERDFLERKGTTLSLTQPPPDVLDIGRPLGLFRKGGNAGGARWYNMDRCGYLSPPQEGHIFGGQRCLAYHDSRRPRICGQFRVNGDGCKAIRRNRGL